MGAAGQQGEEARPVSTLGRYGEFIPLEQPGCERKALRGRRTGRHRDDVIEIAVACENAGRVGEYQCLDEKTRPVGQLDRRHRAAAMATSGGVAASACFCWRRTIPPSTPTPKT